MRVGKVFVLLALLATVFGQQYQPQCQSLDVVYLFDNGNIGGQRSFFEELTYSISGGHNVRFGIAHPFTVDLTASASQLTTQMNSYGGGYSTPGVNAFINAVELLREQSTDDARKALVYVFTGNFPNDGTNNVLAQVNRLKENASFPIELYVLEESPEPSTKYYTQSLSSGMGYYVNGSDINFLGSTNLVEYFARSLNQVNVSVCNGLGSMIATFDGLSFPFNGLGDFWIFRDANFEVQIRIGSCNNDAPSSHTCVRGIAANYFGEPLEILYDPVANYFTYFYQRNIIPHDQFTGLVSNIQLPSVESPLLTFSLEDGIGHILNATAGPGLGLAFTLEVPETAFGKTTGLCGSFDGCAANDFWSANQVYINPASSVSDIYNGFANTWRVNREESLFSYEADQEYYVSDFTDYFPDWSFGSNVINASPQVAANCEYFADKSKFYYDACITEFTLSEERGSLLREYAGYMVGVTCYTYCTQGYLDNPTVSMEFCDAICPTATDIDLHKTDYNYTNSEDLFDFTQYEWGTTFSASLGGTYTLVLNSSFCHDPQVNVTVDLVCDASPVVNAGEDRTVYRTPYQGIQLVLQGSASDVNTDKLRYSWKLIESPSVDQDYLNKFYNGYYPVGILENGLLNTEDYILMSLMNYPFLVVQYTYFIPGNYTFELAVFDGCSIARDTVTITLACSDCDLTITAPPLADILYQRVSNAAYSQSYNGFGDLDRINTNDYQYYDVAFGVNITSNSNNYAVEYEYNGNARSWYFYTALSEVVINSTTKVDVTETIDSFTSDTDLFLQNYRETRYEGQRSFENTVYLKIDKTETIELLSSIDRNYGECFISYNDGRWTVFSDEQEYSLNEVLEPEYELACLGDYNIRYDASDLCASSSDEMNLHIGCPEGPIAHLVTCSKTITYNYNTFQWNTVDLDGRDSRNPIQSDNLYYRFEVVSQPDRATNAKYIPIFNGGCNLAFSEYSVYQNVECATTTFQPTWMGSYTLSLTVSDGCTKSTESTVVTAVCDALTAGATVTNTPNGNEGVGYNQLEFDSTAASPEGHPFATNWYVVSTPAGAREPFAQSQDGTQSTWFLYKGGNYVFGITVNDGCRDASANVSVTYTCGAAPVIATLSSTPATPTFDYITGWEAVDLDVSGVTYNPDHADAVETWELTTKPATVAANWTRTGRTQNYQIDAEGTYVFTFTADNNCNTASKTITVTATCPAFNPVLTSTPANGIYSANDSIPATLRFDLTNGGAAPALLVSWYLYDSTGAQVDQLINTIQQTWQPVRTTPGTYKVSAVATDGCRVVTRNTTVTINCQYSATIAVASQSVTWSNNRFNRVTVTPTFSGNVDPNNLPIDFFNNVHWYIESAPAGSVFAPRVIQNATVTTVSFNESTVSRLGKDLWLRNTTLEYTSYITYYTDVVELTGNSLERVANKFAACFSPDLPGTYTVKFVANGYCGVEQSQTGTVTTTCNAAPTVTLAATKDVSVVGYPVNSRVYVDATASDTDGDRLEYFWSYVAVPADSQIQTNETFGLYNMNSLKAAFDADVAGTYVLQFIASDGCSNTSRTITVNVACNNNFTVPETYHGYSFNGYTPVALKEFTLLAAPKCNKELTWYLADFVPTPVVPQPPAPTPEPEPSAASSVVASLFLIAALLALFL